MSPHPSFTWIAASLASTVVVLGCGSSDSGGGQPAAGTTGGAQSGGAPASGAGGASGASTNGGTGQGGAMVGAGGEGGSGQFCGLESCSGTKKCCASTGNCYDPSFEGCTIITCTTTSNDTGGATGTAGAPNCCSGRGLSQCPAPTGQASLCYHPMCVGCCQ